MTLELAHSDRALPVGAIGRRASGWWGICFFLISEASIFAYLFFAYFYFSIQPQAEWVPGQLPSFTYSAPQSGIMLIGCVTAWWANRSAARGQHAMLMVALGLTIILALAFIGLQFAEWYSQPFSLAVSAYSSIYFTIGALHVAHVVVGLVMFALLLLWTILGYFDTGRYVHITVGALYWYFLAVIWLAIFFVLYGTPYLS